MDITTNNDWTNVGDDYQVQYATTSDPRVIAVIRNQSEMDGIGGEYIDGDAYAPAFYFEHGRKDAAGSTFMDSASEEIAEAYSNARDYFVNQHYRYSDRRRQMDYERALTRYMWIFHQTTFIEVTSTVMQGLSVTVFNTPTYREHVGATDELINSFIVNSVTGPGQNHVIENVPASTEAEAREAHLANHADAGRYITHIERVHMLTGDKSEWQGALDGDVFGIGWATLEAHRLDSEDDDFDYSDWSESIECWNFIGEDYARESAARWDAGTPDLPEMLEIPVNA